jgi:hypothetical protein
MTLDQEALRRHSLCTKTETFDHPTFKLSPIKMAWRRFGGAWDTVWGWLKIDGVLADETHAVLPRVQAVFKLPALLRLQL